MSILIVEARVQSRRDRNCNQMNHIAQESRRGQRAIARTCWLWLKPKRRRVDGPSSARYMWMSRVSSRRERTPTCAAPS
eukprot:1788168-Pleurochrysis_carterae.AAC.1